MSLNAYQRRKIVRKLTERQGPGCAYCGAELTPGPADGRQVATTLTLDHIVPRSRGGSTSLENLALCCAACNAAKGSGPIESFLANLPGRPGAD